MIEVYFSLTHSPDPWVVFLQAVTQEPRFLLSCGSAFLTPHVGVLGCLQSAWGRKWRPLRGALVYPGQDTGPLVSAHNPRPGSAMRPHLTRRGWELPSNRALRSRADGLGAELDGPSQGPFLCTRWVEWPLGRLSPLTVLRWDEELG